MSGTVGFTGTRREPTKDERFRIAGLIHHLPEGTRIVTGGCVGVDHFVAAFARKEGRPVHTVVPSDRSRVAPTWRKHCDTFEEMSTGTSYRDRNARIVELSDRVLAIPDHDELTPESLRSGTWQTIRMGRNAGIETEVHILCPDCDPRRARGSTLR